MESIVDLTFASIGRPWQSAERRSLTQCARGLPSAITPSRAVIDAITRHDLVSDNDILQRLIQKVPHMQVAILSSRRTSTCIARQGAPITRSKPYSERRPIVQRKQRALRLPELPVV